MTPFDQPPSTPPVSFEPPGSRRRSRRRALVVGTASAALIATGAIVIAQLAGNGESQPVARAATPPEPPAAEATDPPATTEPGDTDAPDGEESERSEPEATVDGRIVIRIGDDEPIVIDLGELGEQLDLPELGDLPRGPLPELDDLPDIGRMSECLGEIDLDIDIDRHLGDLDQLDVFGDDDRITVVGPDGVSVFDFGDGDGTITITRRDGEVTITAEGDVEADELFDEPPTPPSLPDLERRFDRLFDCLHPER